MVRRRRLPWDGDDMAPKRQRGRVGPYLCYRRSGSGRHPERAEFRSPGHLQPRRRRQGRCHVYLLTPGRDVSRRRHRCHHVPKRDGAQARLGRAPHEYRHSRRGVHTNSPQHAAWTHARRHL